MIRLYSITALLLAVGCAVLTPEQREAWTTGRDLQREGRHEEAIAPLASVLQAHQDSEKPEVLALRLDLVRSYYALNRFAEAEDYLSFLRERGNLPPEDQVDVLLISGWISLKKAQEGRGAPGSRYALLAEARRHFRKLHTISPGSYEGNLGHGLALYEASRLLHTRTHLPHALARFKTCAALKPEDPVLLFAQARAMQRLHGPGTPEAVERLKYAFSKDVGLKAKVTYREIFEEVAAYASAADLYEKVPDPEQRAYLQTQIELLGQASRRSPGRGEFWDRVKAYLESYSSLGKKEASFKKSVTTARQLLLTPDLSPLSAAQQALGVLAEAEQTAGEDLAVLRDPTYEAAKTEIVKSLLEALGRKIEAHIATENVSAADNLLAEAFALVARDTIPDAVTWARTFQELKEKLTCRRQFITARNELRHALGEKGNDVIRSELAALQERYRLCTEDRDFKELREELFASQSVAFLKTISEAEAAANRKDLEEERRLLGEALKLTVSKEFAHRRDEILLRLADSYIRSELWTHAQLHLKEIDSDRPPPEARLFLATALAREKAFDEAFRIFSRKDLSDELTADVRWAAAAGLTFAKKDRHAQALPLLNTAINAINVKLPFPREELLSTLRSSMTTMLSSPQAISQRDVMLAEHLVTSGRGDADLSRLLGEHFLRQKDWERASKYLTKAQEWGAPVPAEVLARLRACLADYAPVAAGSTWTYRQGDGQELVVTVDRFLGHGRYAITFRAGTAVDSLAWERPPTGKVLRKFFGKGLSRCHRFPVGLSDATLDRELPQTEYEVSGRTWRAQIVGLQESVKTPCGTFEDCLAVDVLQPGSIQPVRHFFAPGVGEVSVEYPQEQRSLNRTLVSFKVSSAPRAVSRDLKPKE